MDMREVVNAPFYMLKTSCQRVLLPHDFPPKGAVYHYFNPWRKGGVGGDEPPVTRAPTARIGARN